MALADLRSRGMPQMVGFEPSVGGSEPLELPGGDKRTFLEDGDSLVMRGWCQGDGYRVGFGEVEGMIRAASSSS